MANAIETLLITQNVYREKHADITMACCFDSSTQLASQIQTLLSTSNGKVLGLAPIYDTSCRLTSLAIATTSHVLVIRLTKQQHGASKKGLQSLVLLLVNPAYTKVAFFMDVLSSSLLLDMQLHITQAVDLLTIAINASRRSTEALVTTLGGADLVLKTNLTSMFKKHGSAVESRKYAATQAWAALKAASLPSQKVSISKIPRIDTGHGDSRVRRPRSYEFLCS
jgi:hypothetical protein